MFSLPGMLGIEQVWVQVYDETLLLASIDANPWQVMLGFGIAMVFQCWWLGNAVVVARRDGYYSIPVFCTAYWFAHDLSVVMRFDQWFFHYNHWYLKLFWFGLLLALILELFFIYQIIKFGRKELLADASPRQFAIIILLTLIGAIAIHEFFKGFFGDPLYQLDPTLTMLVYPIFSAGMMMRRGSVAGQSVTMWWTFAAMTLSFHITTYVYFGQQFSSPAYLAAGLLAALMGLGLCMNGVRRLLLGQSIRAEQSAALTR